MEQRSCPCEQMVGLRVHQVRKNLQVIRINTVIGQKAKVQK